MPISRGDDIRAFLAESQTEKMDRDGQAGVALDHYWGKWWNRWDSSSYTVWEDEKIRTGAVSPISPSIIDSYAAGVVGRGMRLQGVAPENGDRDMAEAARVASGVLRDHERRNYSESRRRRLAKRLLMTGNDFIRVKYDPEVVASLVFRADPEFTAAEYLQTYIKHSGIQPVRTEKLPDGSIRADMPVGGTTEHIVSGNSVFVDNGLQNWRDVRRFAVFEWIPVFNAVQMFGKDLAARMTTSTGNKRTSLSGMQPFYNMDQFSLHTNAQISSAMVPLCEYYEKAGASWDRVLLSGLDLDLEVEPRTSFYLNPYTMYSYSPTEFFWSKSLYQDMRSPQTVINVMTTEKLCYLRESMKDIIVVPMDTDPGSVISNDYHVIIKVNPQVSMAPQVNRVTGDGLRILSETMRDFTSLLMQVGQVSQIAMGDAPDRLSGRAAQIIVDSDSGPVRAFRDLFKESEEELASKILLIAQNQYDVPRLGSFVAKYGDDAVREFSAADITGGTAVELVVADGGILDREQRGALAHELFDKGAFMPEAEQQLRRLAEFRDTGDVGDARPEAVRLAEQQASEEFRLMRSMMVSEGPDALGYFGEEGPGFAETLLVNAVTGEPLITPHQIHAVHLDEHLNDFNRQGVPKFVKSLLNRHIWEHQAMIRAEEDDNARRELELRMAESSADNQGPKETAALAGRSREKVAALNAKVKIIESAVDRNTRIKEMESKETADAS